MGTWSQRLWRQSTAPVNTWSQWVLSSLILFPICLLIGWYLDDDLRLGFLLGAATSAGVAARVVAVSLRRRRRTHRALTERERAVLDWLLSAEFEGADAIREEAKSARVIGTCGCGCPSIDFARDESGMNAVVNAEVLGTNDSLFLYLLRGHLGGIEYCRIDEEMPSELPEPDRLRVWYPPL